MVIIYIHVPTLTLEERTDVIASNSRTQSSATRIEKQGFLKLFLYCYPVGLALPFPPSH